MRRITLLCVVLFFVASSTAWAEPIINVGDYDFLPNEIKTIALYASGDADVAGLNLYLQIDDGGAANSGTGTKPIITDVDIIGAARLGIPDTLFYGNNVGQTNAATTDLLWAVTTLTNSGTVKTADTRTLAFVTINTAGTAAGETYPLLLTLTGDYAGVNTDFAGVVASITNGSINIVPEPSSVVLLCSLLALLPAVVWRRKRLAA